MKNVFTGLFLFFAITMVAQVQKNVVVEHFTNSRCGICSSRNPGLFTNLNNNPNVIHLAIHPSSPYSTCIFNQHNVTENDARTNYYNIYGATPRIVVQGSVVPAATNFGTTTLFTSQAGQTSPFTVRINVGLTNVSGDFDVEVVVKTEATHTYNSLNLFAAIAEDTVFYNAPNGENQHYNVFRKSVFQTDGLVITPSMTIGDSVVFTQTIQFNPTWQEPRILGIAMLQESGSKEVVQASTSRNQIFTSVENIQKAPFQLYSANNQVVFRANEVGNYQVQVFDLQGSLLHQLNSNGQDEWTFDNLITGAYLVRVQSEEKVWAKLLPIVN